MNPLAKYFSQWWSDWAKSSRDYQRGYDWGITTMDKVGATRPVDTYLALSTDDGTWDTFFNRGVLKARNDFAKLHDGATLPVGRMA